MKKSPALILTVCMFFALTQLSAQHIFVDLNASGNDDGSDWPNAYVDLQDALAEAAAGDTIMVAQGTYYPTDSTDRTLSFNIPDSVVILGGYDASDGSRDITVHNTILSGDIGTAGDSTDNSFHVVYAERLSSETVVDGFMITGGNANGGSFDDCGGGWHNAQTDFFQGNNYPTISNCTFSRNTAVSGGAIYSNAGRISQNNPLIINCKFSANIATSGGAIYNWGYGQANPTITGCNFSENRADNGGAIYNEGYSGGESSPTITNCTFSENVAEEDGKGGAICNYADNGESNPVITNCIFIGNEVLGIFDPPAPDEVGSGGAICSYANNGACHPIISNCTFYDNHAAAFGGAIYDSDTNAIISNCILWINLMLGGDFGDIYGGVVSYSLVTTGHPGIGNTGNPPLFVDAANGDLHLLPCSPAIDAGMNDSIPPGISTDLDGNPRIFNSIVDMGAYESQFVFPPGKIYVDQAASGLQDGSSWLDAIPDLRCVLNLAEVSGIDSVLVAQGTYYPTSTDDRTISFNIPDSLVILGGYDASDGSRDIAAHNTILSGDIGTVGDNTDNSYHVVYTQNVSSNTVVDGFTITGGHANGTSFPDDHGGGWYNDGTGNGNVSNPTITNCMFVGNRASVDGGALYNNGYEGQSNPGITNCIFRANHAGSDGGAFYNAGGAGESNPTITNCTFTANTADEYGGAILNDGYLGQSNPIITNCILWGNSAINGGHEIHNYSGAAPIITYTLIAGGHGGTGNMDAVPLFADADNGDLHLLPCSPAIDAGVNDSIPPGIVTDLDENPRIFNTLVDMGAYELQYFLPLNSNLYVDHAADGFDNGSLWIDAYSELQYALHTARCANIDSIFVAQGTYFHTSTSNRSISFNIPDSVVILGGYDASDGSRDITANTTILSGDIGTVGDSTDNSYHVVYASDLSAATVVDGFSITEGLANGSDPHNKGGGWYSGGSIFQGVHSPVISHCQFTNNTAEEGGAIYNSYGNFFGQVYSNIAHCQFSLNVAVRGGAIHNYTNTASQINPNIIQCEFTFNAADEGGAIYNSASGSPGHASPFITDCTFFHNSARNGGAILGRGGGGVSSPLIDNCTFSDNSATIGTGDRYGGAIYNYTSGGESSPTFSNCIFKENFANTGGGALYNNGAGGVSSPVIDNCLFTENWTTGLHSLYDGGGAMFNNTSNPVITNCLFTKNFAFTGGGAISNVLSSSPTICNSTFTNNKSLGLNLGGAMHNEYSNPVITNCILWGDSSALGGYEISDNTATPVITYSLIADGYAGTGNLDADPLFTDAANGLLYLQPGSPAFNAGINDSIPAGITTDLDGNPRIQYDTVDMGAYEFDSLYCDYVITAADSGYGSLPAIMDCKPMGGTVRFHPLLSDASIRLTSTPLQIGEDKLIIADPLANITIDASMITRAFDINAGVSLELEGLRIISGTATEGSAFNVSGSLIIRNAVVDPNPVPGNGHKISGSGTILLEKEVLVN